MSDEIQHSEATRRDQAPSTWPLAAACLLLAASCNLNTSPTRIAVDPRLDDIIADAGNEVDAQDDADDATTHDADADAPGDPSTFRCDPPCRDGSFCLPSGLCAPLAEACGSRDVLCDPTIVPPTTDFVCEGVFGGAGLCRTVCERGSAAPDNGCANDESCTRLYVGADIFVCHPPCATDTECDALDTCTGSPPFRQCRGGCLPFVSGQCPDGRTCLPERADRGYCQTAGDAGLGEECQGEGDCEDGLFCFGTAGGSTCLPYCDPNARTLGRCPADDDLCVELASRDLGVCLAGCDIFDPSTACPDGTGCLLLDGQTGGCTRRGQVQLHGGCAVTDACAGDLQCITDNGEGHCEQVCLRAASSGQQGACPDGMNCAALGSGEIGICR